MIHATSRPRRENAGAGVERLEMSFDGNPFINQHLMIVSITREVTVIVFLDFIFLHSQEYLSYVPVRLIPSIEMLNFPCDEPLSCFS